MSDPISAVAASSAQPNLPSTSPSSAGSFSTSLSFSDLAGAPSPAETRMSSDFQNIVKDFQSKMSGYTTQKTGAVTAVTGSDAVATHKLEFFPQSARPSVGSSASPAAAGAAEMLTASFDHALFVTLVSQVVSGVGQTVSTLIKQQ